MCPSMLRMSQSIAPVYVPKKGYAAGDVVMINGVRRVAIATIPDGEAYDPSKWVSEDVQSALESGGGGVRVVKSVNDIVPDAEGNVTVSVVDSARNLVSTELNEDVESFVARTSGGNADIGNGPAYLRKIEGNSVNSVHEAFGTITCIKGGSVPTVTVDAVVFGSAVGNVSGEYILVSEADGWTLGGAPIDLEWYGVYVSGTVGEGDLIRITYSYVADSLYASAYTEREGATLAIATLDVEACKDGLAVTVTKDYTLVYDDDGSGKPWLLETSTRYSLDEIGITLDGTPDAGDTIFIRYEAAQNVESHSYGQAGVSASFTNRQTFRTFVDGLGVLEAGGTKEFVFVYDGDSGKWTYDDEEVSDLASVCGITAVGDFSDGGSLDFEYTKERMIAIPRPAVFKSIGFNGFDKATMIKDGVAWINIALSTSSSFRGYVVYSKTGAVKNVGVASVQYGTVTPVSRVTDSALVARVTDGETATGYENALYAVGSGVANYLVIEMNEASGFDYLCVHPCWSGQAAWQDAGNADYVPYSESYITVPMVDAAGNELPTASVGLPAVDDVRDAIDFTTRTYIKAIDVLAYTKEKVDELVEAGKVEGHDFIYDSRRILVVRDEVERITLAASVRPEFIVNDWSIEMFVGTDFPVVAHAAYGQNLVRKLERDTVTFSGFMDIPDYVPELRFVRAQWKPNFSYLAGEEVWREDSGSATGYYRYRCSTTHVSESSWNEDEKANWTWSVFTPSPLFVYLKSLVSELAEAACKYKLNDADTNGVLDRAINTTTASEIEIPADFTDLILKVSGAVTKLTMTGITSAYGDDLPTKGNNLITVTRIAEGAVFVKVVAMEDNRYAGA